MEKIVKNVENIRGKHSIVLNGLKLLIKIKQHVCILDLGEDPANVGEKRNKLIYARGQYHSS